jgi:2-keto-4-pentenoate hydratase/2-oxohepta-3-ene-1,7-dioic acid hydratase in catechol pathway
MKLIHLDFGVGVERTDGNVLPIGHIIGIGRNYHEHAKEQGETAPERPMIFTKNPASACLSGESIVIPALCRDEETGGPHQVDFEAELGVVIGTAATDVPIENALGHVLGYACVNDVSARWWQKQGAGGQFCRGKSFDTFCPIGPRLVPAPEIPDPQALRVLCRVNGTVMQQDSTASMIHPVATLIAELSRGMTLAPGTLILTGTPSGVGMARKPPVYLKEGDTVEVEIERIGTLKNAVVNR